MSAKVATKRKRKQDESSSYDKIIEAAKELFAENGFRDTTIRMIAMKAHVNGASINYYFRSKDQLYEAIFEQAFQKFGRPLETLVGSVVDQASWEEALRNWLDFMLKLFLLDTPERSLFRRLVAQERSAPTQFCTRIYDGVFLPVVYVFRNLLRMALPDMERGEFQAIFITQLGQCTCFMHRDPPWDLLEIYDGMPREEWIDCLRDQILQTIRARFSFKTNRIPIFPQMLQGSGIVRERK